MKADDNHSEEDMKISVIKQKAKKALAGNWFGAIFVLVLLVVLAVILDATVIGTVFSGLLAFGYAAYCLELIKSKKSKIGAFFGGTFKGFFKKWWASILVGLYTLLWSLLLIIPGLIKSYSYAMTPYIMAEKPDMSASDAITKSRQIMNGHKWQLFCLDLSFTGWMLLSMVTLGLGLIYVWPYYNAARAAFYKEIKKGGGK